MEPDFIVGWIIGSVAGWAIGLAIVLGFLEWRERRR